MLRFLLLVSLKKSSRNLVPCAESLCGLLLRLVQARATWEEGNKARIEAEKQKKEMKDAKRVEEMNQLRNLPASEGGFMFKAREFERGIESNPRKTVPVHSSKPPLTQPQTPKFATNTRSRCYPK